MASGSSFKRDGPFVMKNLLIITPPLIKTDTMKPFLIIVVMSIHFTAYSQVIINELDLTNNWVELYNPTSATIDVSNMALCKRPSYARISNLTILNGSTTLAPNSYVVIEWSQINMSSRELGLYISTGGYSNTTRILDYVQYGGVASPTRAGTAVAAGVWDDVNHFVPLPTASTKTLNNFNTAASSGMQTNSNHWWDGGQSMNLANECILSYSIFNANRITNAESGNADYETDGKIESLQRITSSAIVDYDSALSIEMLEGFEIELGAQYLAFIDGCNGGAGGLHK